jgi:hypothetical protein
MSPVHSNFQDFPRNIQAKTLVHADLAGGLYSQVMFLAWLSCRGIVGRDAEGKWYSQITVAPLFETIPDLEVMPQALNQILSNDTYKNVLAASGNIQEVSTFGNA